MTPESPSLLGCDPPPFPVGALPPWLARFASSAATALQVPVDMMGMLCLASLSAASAGRCRIEVRDGYSEVLSLFVVVAMAPGSRKSAAFRLALGPVEEFEREGNHRLLTDDVTPARLASLLSQSGGRIAVVSPEAGVFQRMASDAGLDIFLKGHAGDTIRIDRMGRGSILVERPSLTVALTVQPEVLRGLAARPHLRGRGLLARFLYSVPASMMGRRLVDPPQVPGEVLEGYRDGMRRLLELDGERAVRLSPEAESAWISFSRELEPRLGEDGDLGAMADWGGKLAGAVARVAGLLHLARHSDCDALVSAATVASAADIGCYLTHHAKAAFARMEADPVAQVLEDARRVVRWIRERRLPVFAARDAFEALKGTFKSMSRLRPALEMLEGFGYLRLADQPERSGPGRRPSPVYRVNRPPPLRLVPQDSEDCSNSTNSLSPERRG
jgi:replicative DNA helicase